MRRIKGWNGTAQARIDSGSYGASPQSGTAVGGTNQTCEWGTGTLSLPQYEPGAIRTSFEFRDDELIRCRKYYKTGQGMTARMQLTFRKA